VAQTKRSALVPVHDITRAILVLRGQRVLLDAELASLYGVTTKRLNEQVRRNLDRFPADFTFQLTAAEATALRSQIATSNTTLSGRGGRRYWPYAFTEHGAIRAANVLNSPRRRDGDLRRARLRTVTRTVELEQGSSPAPRSARSAHREEARHPR
jgi:ORF6N domain